MSLQQTGTIVPCGSGIPSTPGIHSPNRHGSIVKKIWDKISLMIVMLYRQKAPCKGTLLFVVGSVILSNTSQFKDEDNSTKRTILNVITGCCFFGSFYYVGKHLYLRRVITHK